MNIGIDLDGVIFDSENMLRTVAVLFDKEINGSGVINPNGVICQEMYGWTPDQERLFLDKYLVCTEKTAPFMPCVKEIITYLKNMGHTLHIISRRGVEDEEEINVSLDRLNSEGIKFDTYNFSVKDKLIKCKELNIDIMIDDNNKIISSLVNNNIKTLHYRNVYSSKIDHINNTEVYNWGDVFREISKIS